MRTTAVETGWAPAASRPTETPRPTFGGFGSPQPIARAAFSTSPIDVGVERPAAGSHLLPARAQVGLAHGERVEPQRRESSSICSSPIHCR